MITLNLEDLMDILRITKANCKNCYKCLRECPVKSIGFKNDQAEILDADCIYCGHCLSVCPQKAKHINSELPDVKDMILRGERVYVSLAPSFVAAFPDHDFPAMTAALKKLGFLHVEETAVGADAVTREYERIMREHKMKNIIATCCSSTVLLVEKYFPELIPQLAPVASPMLAHARMLREIYGPRIKVVFIGPCVAKKHEAQFPTSENAVSAVITFDDLAFWFAGENVSFEEKDSEARTMKNPLPRFYPVPGGIIRNIIPEYRSIYNCVSADGIEACMEILHSLADNRISNYFLELSVCPGSCADGPGMASFQTTRLTSKEHVIRHVTTRQTGQPSLTEGTRIKIAAAYNDLSPDRVPATAEAIQQVLLSMGKTSPDKELNCGCCGYSSCRAKAQAVIDGKATVTMCLPFFREKAESLSNLIVDSSPNAIIMTDSNFCIQEYNPAARKLLGPTLDQHRGDPIFDILEADIYARVLSGGKNILGEKVQYERLGLIVKQSVLALRDNDSYLILMEDITEHEKQKSERMSVNEKTVDIAQKVIDKQMRVAQEIASLLGETTADTKTALSKLKKSILDEMSE